MNGIRSSIFRVLRVTLIVLALIGAAVWLRNTLTSLESEQAVINAEIIQIRTPIAGELEVSDVRPGMLLKKGTPLFKIVNPRFGDRESVAQYNGLQNLVETLQGELLGAKQSLAIADTARARSRRLYKKQLIPRVQMEEDEVRFTNAEKLVVAKAEQIARSEERAKEMAEQMAMQKESTVVMPADGLVWSIAGKSGEQIDSNKLVMDVINPSHIWVDAFFAERFAQELKPGLPAVVRSLDSASVWKGHLRSVRAGVGRLAYDTTVAVPPPEMAKRQVAVRVEANWEQPFGAPEFFGVGRSVQVKFTRGSTQRTVGDALKEKWQRALSQARSRVAGVTAR